MTTYTQEHADRMLQRVIEQGASTLKTSEVIGLLNDFVAQAKELEAYRRVCSNGQDELFKLQAENHDLKTKGEQLCCRVGVLEMENQTLKAEVTEVSGYLMRLVNENADHQLEIHKLKNTLEANHVQMNPRQDEAVSWDRSLEFGWHRYWLTRTYFEQAAKDANEMARLVQANIRELFEHDGMVGWDELPEWKYAQTIIDRYKSDGRRVWKRKEG